LMVAQVGRKRKTAYRVYVYIDKKTGYPKGDATITYESVETAALACQTLNGTPFCEGYTISVTPAELNPKKAALVNKIRRGKADAASSFSALPVQRSRSGREIPPGDWECLNGGCGNINFSRRTECNLCHTPRPASSFASSGYPSATSQSSRGGGGPPMKDGDWTCSSCQNVNWARRTSCHRCQAPRSANDSDFGGRRGDRDQFDYRGGRR
jgi:RNA-binding protein EWS